MPRAARSCALSNDKGISPSFETPPNLAFRPLINVPFTPPSRSLRKMSSRTEFNTSPTRGPVPPRPCTVQGPETLDVAFYLKARLTYCVSQSHTRKVTGGDTWEPASMPGPVTDPSWRGAAPTNSCHSPGQGSRGETSKQWKNSEDGDPRQRRLGPARAAASGRKTPMHAACPGAHARHPDDPGSEHAPLWRPGRVCCRDSPRGRRGLWETRDTRRQRPPRGSVFLFLALTSVFPKKVTEIDLSETT